MIFGVTPAGGKLGQNDVLKVGVHLFSDHYLNVAPP
jgi:hypothetical protein